MHWRGLPALLQAAAENCFLKSLTLDSVGVGPMEAAFMASQLREQQPHLAELSLVGNPLGCEGAAALARGWLAGDSALGALDLRRTQLAAAGLAALAAALGAPGSSLRRLSLAGNALSSVAAAGHLAALVGRCASLVELDASECGILGDNVGPLVQALACDELQSASLRRLVLRGNRLGESGALHLAGALRVSQQLRALDCGDNGISAAGAIGLANAMRANPGVLRELAIENNAIGDAGWRALAAQRSPNLLLLLG